IYCSCKFEWLSLFHLYDLNFRLIHRDNIRFLDRICIGVRQEDINGVLVQALNAETSLENRSRYFSFTEAGNIYVSYNFFERFIQSFCEFFALHLHGKYTAVLLYFFPINIHFMPSPPTTFPLHFRTYVSITTTLYHKTSSFQQTCI